MNPTTVELIKLATLLFGAIVGTILFALGYYIFDKKHPTGEQDDDNNRD